ncbi:hypothetical protein FJQ98_02885 [Lysinibacillus agricola]|uniref:RNA helicase n=1 Tax=Lysinibacillus agricola TaxID=2590012 RepID=A0ABX7ASV5_9BACI|nr:MULTISPECIES: RNA helicase [Lysinibacillus]QQP13035.1 hypothetical protein FJQ98_02885 [Lysinibacillus agricola]
MPIAPMFDYTAEHWLEVKSIITQAVSQVADFKFKTDIVSNSDGEIDVIHKRIVQNLYNADIVICDISGRNPNVLFELGMRLTFDKPTIIIKDDKTDFIFDTGLIEHLTYPRDLRFNRIVKFQAELANAVIQTYKKSKNDPTYSTFLGNFGEFKVPALNQTPVSDVQQLILDEISSIRREVNSLKTNSPKRVSNDDKHLKMKMREAVQIYADFNDLDDEPIEIISRRSFNEHLNNFGIVPTIENMEYILNLITNYKESIIKNTRVNNY